MEAFEPLCIRKYWSTLFLFFLPFLVVGRPLWVAQAATRYTCEGDIKSIIRIMQRRLLNLRTNPWILTAIKETIKMSSGRKHPRIHASKLRVVARVASIVLRWTFPKRSSLENYSVINCVLATIDHSSTLYSNRSTINNIILFVYNTSYKGLL